MQIGICYARTDLLRMPPRGCSGTVRNRKRGGHLDSRTSGCTALMSMKGKIHVRQRQREDWDPETGAGKKQDAVIRGATLNPRNGSVTIRATARWNRGARSRTFDNPKRGSPDGKIHAHAETRWWMDGPRGPHAERSRKRHRGAA
jgi:hypothetical protein